MPVIVGTDWWSYWLSVNDCLQIVNQCHWLSLWLSRNCPSMSVVRDVTINWWCYWFVNALIIYELSMSMIGDAICDVIDCSSVTQQRSLSSAVPASIHTSCQLCRLVAEKKHATPSYGWIEPPVDLMYLALTSMCKVFLQTIALQKTVPTFDVGSEYVSMQKINKQTRHCWYQASRQKLHQHAPSIHWVFN